MQIASMLSFDHTSVSIIIFHAISNTKLLRILSNYSLSLQIHSTIARHFLHLQQKMAKQLVKTTKFAFLVDQNINGSRQQVRPYDDSVDSFFSQSHHRPTLTIQVSCTHSSCLALSLEVSRTLLYSRQLREMWKWYRWMTSQPYQRNRSHSIQTPSRKLLLSSQAIVWRFQWHSRTSSKSSPSPLTYVIIGSLVAAVLSIVIILATVLPIVLTRNPIGNVVWSQCTHPWFSV